MSALQPNLVTEAQFLALPETHDKVELLDGEVIVAPAPTWRHQVVLKNVLFALESWARQQADPFTVGQAPTDIRFATGRILQPDAFVLRGAIDIDTVGPLDRVPDLCIEVLSSDRVHDRVTKRLIYAASGVREYWTVEPTGVVERWHGEGLVEVEVVAETLRSPQLPGFALDVSTLTR